MQNGIPNMSYSNISSQGWFEMQINTKCSKIIWIVSKLQVGCLVRQVTFGGLTLAEQYLWLDGLSSLIWRGSNVITLSIPQYQYQPQIQNKKKNRRDEIFSDYGWPIFSACLIISKLAEHMPSNISNLDRLCSIGQLNRYLKKRKEKKTNAESKEGGIVSNFLLFRRGRCQWVLFTHLRFRESLSLKK